MATPSRVAPPPPPIRKGQVVAVEVLHSYKAKRNGELTVEEGDLLFILDQTDKNWWHARLEDKEGLVPSNYLSQHNARVPLIDGARRGNSSLVRECLRAGVAITALDRAGSSALHAAAQGGHVQCAQYLLDCPGVLIDLQNKLGDTPLHCAASKGHDEVVRLLLQRGAKQDVLNNDGQTPRCLARRPSVLAELDASLLQQQGSRLRPSSYADDEYGNEEDSD